MNWQDFCEDFGNAIVVICLTLLAFEAMAQGLDGKEIALCIVSGLVGYLSKKSKGG